MRKVEQLDSGRYKVRYRHGVSPKTGRPRQASQSFDTRKEAERFAVLLDALDPQRALDQMFEEGQQREVPDMDQLAADHIGLLTGVEDGTRLNYQRLWARTWGPRIGRIPATHLTRDDLARATNELASSYSAKSLKNQRGLLAAVCDRAVDLRYLPTNPTKRLRLPRAKETERRDMRILTAAELAGVFTRVHPHYRLFVMFLAGMGCRYGEAVALQVQDVTLPDVRIRRALKWSPDNKRTVGATKTKRSNRTVRVPTKLRPMLASAIDGKPGDALLFTAPRGGPINHRTFWSDIWLPVVEHLSPRPRIHDLRHTHASMLLAEGRPLLVVSRRLGHESVTTTGDVYGHMVPDAQAQAADAADVMFESIPLELD